MDKIVQVAPPGFITLREYVDVRFKAQESAVAAALTSAERAVTKSENAAERRFDSVNEFRSTLSDQARLLMPRAESEQTIRALSDKVDMLVARMNQNDDRGRGMGQVWSWIVGAAGILAIIVSYLRGTHV